MVLRCSIVGPAPGRPLVVQARKYFVPGTEPPKVGDEFTMTDKKAKKDKSLRVRLVEIVTHIHGGDIYRVEVL